jgi:hypothetical protein
LITVKRTEAEIVWLQHYLYPIENYAGDTMEKKVIKEYAITNSIGEVIKNFSEQGYTVEKEYISAILKSRGKDEQHKISRTGYMMRTKPSRHHSSYKSGI